MKLNKSNYWDSLLPFPALPGWASVLTVGLLSIVCYSATYKGTFVFDDSEAVVNNHDVNLSTPVIKIFSHDFWGTRLTNNASHKSYRPLTILSFRFNVWLNNGELSPMSFHITNIILHAVVSCLLLQVYNSLFRNEAPKTSFLASVMFAVHPVHTEVVSSVVGRADLLSACLFLLVFIIYHNAANSKTISFKVNLATSLFCCILSFIAMLCKEQGVMILIVCSAYELIVINKITIQTLVKNAEFSKLSGMVKKESFDRLVTLTVGFLIIIYTRWSIMGSPPVFQPIDNPASFLESRIEKIVNYSYIYIINIWIMLCPIWLCFDWSMGCVSLIHLNQFPQDPRLFLVFGFWIVLVFITYKILYSDDCHQRQIQMGFVIGAVSFLPASNLLFRVGFVIAERALYLPSIGFILIVVLGIRKLCREPIIREIVGVCVVMMLMVQSIRTYQRSEEWNSEYILFKSALKVCPMNAKVHYNLAKNLADSGNTSEAINRYRQALELHPEYDQAMNNLANILKDQNKLEEAKALLEKAVSIRKDFAAAWMNLGIVLSGLKNFKEAEFAYLTALRHRRRYPHCYYNLGNLYLEQGQNTKALLAWQNATFQQPTHIIAWSNMIVMLDSIGELKRAENVARKALSILPDEPSLHFNMANILGKLNKYSESEKHFLTAIQLKNMTNNLKLLALYHANLGVLYHRWKKYELAESHYLQALNIDSKMQSPKDNLVALRRHLNEINQPN
ncbi:protein O-mannosyl-transferase TMTC4-like [Adelges cooleyi]|uniref:protein O-mannosyl-transferase TMTC4-like n=1 Tax=Adelges cooleyi TaxID=133065 RepID=UPI00218031F1|nr:protein O-mannosyl-transferase TMTC4-like [Adelges cooleyi]